MLGRVRQSGHATIAIDAPASAITLEQLMLEIVTTNGDVTYAIFGAVQTKQQLVDQRLTYGTC
jgi:hypothetical protein